MDTSISVEGKSYEGLMTSGFAEEKELAEKMAKVVDEIVTEIKPVLKYVSQPIPLLEDDQHCPSRVPRLDTRGVEIDRIRESGSGITRCIFLGEDGKFFTSKLCSGGHYQGQSGNMHYSWQLVPLEKLIEGLQKIFQAATQKREHHLASIRERSEKLDTVLAILKPSYR